MGPALHRRGPRTVLVGTIALAAVFTTTALFDTTIPVNASTAGFAYLIEVLITAAYGGLYESIAASIAAAFCFNYFFLPPLGTWVISDPQNWVALFAFLASVLIASQLSANARRRASEATDQRHQTERLYELSRSVMLMKPNQSMAGQLASEVLRVYAVRGVAVFDLTHQALHTAGNCGMPDMELRLKKAARDGTSEIDPKNEVLVRPLTLGGKCIGSIFLNGITGPDPAVHALLNLISISLENATSRHIALRAEAVRQSEEFKSTLLDALAHEFKTPLTSIKGATSALLAGDNLDAGQREDLLTVVDQEADRLNRLVTETTQLARIEAGKLQLNREQHSLTALLGAALDQMSLGRDGRRVNLSVAEGLPPVWIDLPLMELALRQLLDNAAKYSEPGSPLRISARIKGNSAEVAVHNWGDTLSPEERGRIFEKFYRGSNARQNVLGTGMGLTIAREILAAHGGGINVDSSDEGGTEFIVDFPVKPEEKEA